MNTMTRTIDQENFDHEAQRIRVGVSKVLKKWGLLPRFKRWRLAKDPGTGMVVLFGVLNNGYLAAHTATPFTDYFQPRLLHELANQLQVQLVSCNTDGLRYAFILDRGQIDTLPSHIDFPYTDNGKLAFRVVYSENPVDEQAPAVVDDRNRVHRGVGAFLKVFDDIQLRNGALPAFRPIPAGRSGHRRRRIQPSGGRARGRSAAEQAHSRAV
jgi:hypothetical protein